MEGDNELLARFDSTSRAQSRYLYLLAVALVFFFIVDSNIKRDSEGTSPIHVPGLDLVVEPRVLWLVSPFIIGVLVLAVLGALQAATSAWEAIRNRPRFKDSAWEHLDTAPNLIDFAVFTTHKSPRLGRCLAYLSYPSFLTFAWSESVRILVRVVRSPETGPSHRLIAMWFVLLSVPVVWRLLALWIKKGKAIRQLLQAPHH